MNMCITRIFGAKYDGLVTKIWRASFEFSPYYMNRFSSGILWILLTPLIPGTAAVLTAVS